MGATKFGRFNQPGKHCFNPRARDGRDLHDRHKNSDPTDVSIHAPVMGATQKFGSRNECTAVSIHAPVMGATKTASAPMGSGGVSIHAPVMGATSRPCDTLLDTLMFQSTRP